MPPDVHLEQSCACVTYRETVTLEDVLRVIAAVDELGISAGRPLDRLHDMSGSTGADVDFDTMCDIVARRSGGSADLAGTRAAFVVPNPVHRGFARMYQTLMDASGQEIRLFKTRAEAEAWLGL